MWKEDGDVRSSRWCVYLLYQKARLARVPRRMPGQGTSLGSRAIDLDQYMNGVNKALPASSRLSPLTLKASNTLLPPLRSHGQQLGKTRQRPCQRLLRSTIHQTGNVIDGQCRIMELEKLTRC